LRLDASSEILCIATESAFVLYQQSNALLLFTAMKTLHSTSSIKHLAVGSWRIIMLLALLVTQSQIAQSQTVIKGRVLDERGKGLPGANIAIKNTYDGGSADAEGNFQFKAFDKGAQVITCSFVGYETLQQAVTLNGQTTTLTLKMRELSNELNTVTITAGTFEASDEKKTTLIKPIDIVTTAGGGADITQSMTLLTPGAQRNGESTGLFVRGGSAQESKILIDGLTVQNAFNTPAPDVAARSRFAPFQFKGSAFSTGGYSAQYGQALSAVLQMHTTDLATESGYALNANLAQLSAGYTHLSDKQSLNGTVAYNNLTPLFAVYPQNIDWIKIPRQLNVSTSYRLKPSAAASFKFDAVYGKSASALRFGNPETNQQPMAFGINNDNLLITSTYQNTLDANANWILKSGASYSYNFDTFKMDNATLSRSEKRTQARAVLSRLIGQNNTILFGTELHTAQYGFSTTRAALPNGNESAFALTDNYGAFFAEADVYVTRKLAARIGARGEYSSLANGFNAAPRVSLAYKTGQYSQVSVAGGKFYQTPDYQYYFLNKNLQFENATHAVLNYQIIKNKRTLRVEGYYKKYDNLIREYAAQEGFFDANPRRFPNGRTDNAGYGYAQGVDVFLRDSKTVKNGDFWLNYSYCDSKRLFGNYLAQAQPTFVSNHNLNLIYKHFIAKPMMTVSATYSFTSGRPYYNPNNTQFLTDRTPNVHNTSVWINYLTNIKGNFMVVYLSVDNVLGTRNVFNYQYSADGKTRTEIRPAAYRTIMIGTYITISKKKVLPEDMQKQ
jgi:CarboxypepD_reg-like domain/TonB-dependent Receptor Plug Domain